jgi:hypothetical protein
MDKAAIINSTESACKYAKPATNEKTIKMTGK